MKPTSELSIHDPVLCDTTHLGIIKFSGEDTTTFLQGQFSHDVNLLTNENSQLSSYNSPKGRMIASFRLFKFNDDFFMVLPKEIIEPLVKRLRMFVMRSKVVLENLSNTWASIGISSPKIEQGTIQCPKEINGALHTDDAHYLRLPGSDERLLIVAPVEKIEELKNKLADTYPLSTAEHWQRLDIHTGCPNIYSNTQESFVAQMINFQLIDGISFTKGCYPGQEVVARMHYLGKLKKQMYRITLNGSHTPAPGDNVYLDSDENKQSVGQIVAAQLNNNNGVDALAVIQISAIEKGNLIVEDASIKIESLPYALS